MWKNAMLLSRLIRHSIATLHARSKAGRNRPTKIRREMHILLARQYEDTIKLCLSLMFEMSSENGRVRSMGQNFSLFAPQVRPIEGRYSGRPTVKHFTGMTREEVSPTGLTVGYRDFFPKTKLKNLKASTHTTPMRCTSMGCTPSEVHVREAHANEVHVQ
jgi:hypothetical protein